ncbi:MAG: hypothetical protein KAX38_05495, partial [Candidatus Krumholzibacteria bacterium]|nr:hypothetical protein [Candidatus Krumholzibacteria bacterium]
MVGTVVIDRDIDNITYLAGMDSLRSEEGRRFLEQKYTPRIKFLKNYFGARYEGIRLLDVGIGYGMFLSKLEENGFTNLFGMDPFSRS